MDARYSILEALLSDANGNSAMGRQDRSAQYLTAVSSYAAALARAEHAQFDIECADELAKDVKSEEVRQNFANLRKYGERALGLARLELDMLDHWVNTLSGGYWKRSVLSHALIEHARAIANGPSEPLFDALGEATLSTKEMEGLSKEQLDAYDAKYQAAVKAILPPGAKESFA